MGLWVPPEVSDELVGRRKDYAAQILELLRFDGPVARAWNPELREIDPFLSIGQAHEHVPPGFPLVPGYWHLVRLNPHAPPTTTPLQGPGREFVEPSGQMLERLRESDLQNPRVMRDRARREELAKALDERRKARDRQERQEEIMERAKAAWGTQVSMIPGWSQNASGKRGRKK